MEYLFMEYFMEMEKEIYCYETALEMLDEMYNLGLKIKYKEIKTNF